MRIKIFSTATGATTEAAVGRRTCRGRPRSWSRCQRDEACRPGATAASHGPDRIATTDRLGRTRNTNRRLCSGAKTSKSREK